MKRKLTTAEYGKLSEALQALYKKAAEGTKDHDYALDLEDDEDTSALKSARDRERDAAKKLREEKAAIEARIQELEDEKAEMLAEKDGKGSATEALRKSYEAKLAKQTEKHTAELSRVTAALRQTHVDAVAEKIAGEISTVPALLAAQIKARLAVDFSGEAPATQVLGPDGKPSAATLAELREEFLSNPAYASIMIAGKGSGGGAGGGSNGGGAFDAKAYKNEDGTTNWTKVHAGMQKDPELLKKVQEAANPSAT